MTKSRKEESKLAQFLGWMKDIESISQAATHADPSKTHLHELNDKGEKQLKTMAYEYALRTESIDPSLTPNPNALTGDEVKRYVGARQAEDIRYATRTVHSDLDALVEEMDDKQAATALGDKNLAGLADGKNREWFGLYQQVAAVKDYADRAKKGQLKKEESEAVVKGRAEELRKSKFDKLMEKTGKDKYLSGLGADAHVASYLAGHVESIKDYIANSAQEMVKEAEGQLARYEKEKETNMRTYLTSTLGKLAKADLNKARDTFYSYVR